jgi:hypothetical protein
MDILTRVLINDELRHAFGFMCFMSMVLTFASSAPSVFVNEAHSRMEPVAPLPSSQLRYYATTSIPIGFPGAAKSRSGYLES